MVQLGSMAHHGDGHADIIVSLSSLALMLCLVVVVLGIKFFWFKQRLNFEPIPTGTGSTDNGVVLTRSSRNSQEQFREPVVAQGTFRRRLEEDVIIDRPRILPPVRIRKTSNRPLSFVPPKRSETQSSIVNEPAVVPPPPPPLPISASAPLLHQNGSSSAFEKMRSHSPPKEPEKSSPILTNGNGFATYEPLKSAVEQTSRPYSERRATGYVRPSAEELEQENENDEESEPERSDSDELAQKKESNKPSQANALVREAEMVEREPPKIQPRSTLKETFKKNPARGSSFTMEPLKDEDDQDGKSRMGQRRLTGFFPPEPEEIHDDTNTVVRPHNKVAFALSDDDDDDDEDNDTNASDSNSDNNTSTIPPPPPLSPPPILLSTQLSTDDEPNSPDSWTAIQRHRNLAQEITERHAAMQNRKRENAESIGEFRNPLAAQQPKPRTMRDMKRNNARNDLLLDDDRRASTEA